MKKLALIGTALLLSSTAMATDFQALTVLQGATPVQLQDSELATTEGGAFCTVPDASAGNGQGGASTSITQSGCCTFNVLNKLCAITMSPTQAGPTTNILFF